MLASGPNCKRHKPQTEADLDSTLDTLNNNSSDFGVGNMAGGFPGDRGSANYFNYKWLEHIYIIYIYIFNMLESYPDVSWCILYSESNWTRRNDSNGIRRCAEPWTPCGGTLNTCKVPTFTMSTRKRWKKLRNGQRLRFQSFLLTISDFNWHFTRLLLLLLQTDLRVQGPRGEPFEAGPPSPRTQSMRLEGIISLS